VKLIENTLLLFKTKEFCWFFQVFLRIIGGLNMIRGLFIFLVFICKPSVWELTKRRHPKLDSSWNGGHRNRKPSRPASHDGFQRKWKNADSSFVGAERREQNREGWIQGNPSLRRTLYLDVVWVNSKHYQIPNS
jgi:hypothetical protein